MEVDLENPKTLKIQVDTGENKKRGLPWVLVVFIIVIVLVLMVKLFTSIVMYRQRKKQERQCSVIRSSGSICVLLYNHNNSRSTASTIFSLFHQSYCARNVYVAVYQELFEGGQDVYDYLKRMVSCVEDQYLIDHNVGIVSVDNTSVGHLWAIRELLQRNIFPKTSWCMLVHPGAQFEKHWDKTVLDAHHHVGTDSVVLTSMVTKEPIVKVKSKDTHVVSNWINSLVGQGQSVLKKQRKGSGSSDVFFPVVTTFKGYVPVISKQRFSQSPDRPVKVSAVTSQCTFMKMSTMLNMLDLELFNVPVASYATDTVLSAMLWMEESTFHAIRPVVHSSSTSKKENIRPEFWDGKQISTILQKDYQPYFDYLGIDLTKRIVSGRAMMGISPTQSMDEILTKYGSMAEYDRVQRRLKIDTSPIE